MNEDDGYPSNLEEATKIKTLETQVSNINTNIENLARVMSQALGGPNPAPPPIPQANLADEPIAVPPEQLRILAAYQMETPVLQTATPTAPTSEPPSSTPPLPVPGSGPATPDPGPIVDLGPPPGQPGSNLGPMTDPDGYVEMMTAKGLVRVPMVDVNKYPVVKTVPKPPMSLGPVGSNVGQGLPPDLENFVEDEAEDVIPLLAPAEVVPEPQDQEAVGKLDRHQNLVGQVTEWLQTKDVDKFWRRFVAGSCNKNLSYNTWPLEIQRYFNKRFHQLLQDPAFVSRICKQILTFSNGHLVSPHVAAGFIVTTAGFLSFALLEA